MKDFFFLFSLLLLGVQNLQCGEEIIEHCLECGEGMNMNFCQRCEDKYFLFFGNLSCLPCDDEVYGQVGCGGKCSLSIPDSLSVLCEKDGCKDGYYYLNNICQKCSDNDQTCGKCTYNPPSGYSSNYFSVSYFNCTECINDQYSMKYPGDCWPCLISDCSQCHFINRDNICDKCNSGYYLENNECKKCDWKVQPEGKVCQICSDNPTDIDPDNCVCPIYFTQGDSKEKCIPCPENCYNCGYNPKNTELKCYQCDEGYTLNSEGICISCGVNCDFCYLDSNNNPICLYCKTGSPINNCLQCEDNCESCKKGEINDIECIKCKENYGLYSNKTCGQCPQNCKSCFWKEAEDEFGCSECISSSYIIGKDDQCILCEDIEEIGGEGCTECYYDKNSEDDNKYKCTKCLESNMFLTGSSFIFVKNENRCLNISSSSETTSENFYGCNTLSYNNGKYECIECDSSSIFIQNERRCLSFLVVLLQGIPIPIFCKEAINKGSEQNPDYVCLSCHE